MQKQWPDHWIANDGAGAETMPDEVGAHLLRGALYGDAMSGTDGDPTWSPLAMYCGGYRDGAGSPGYQTDGPKYNQALDDISGNGQWGGVQDGASKEPIVCIA